MKTILKPPNQQSLLLQPPPLQSWQQPLFTKRKIQVDVLRLDKMHPIAGGNKWMKLRGFLQKAIMEKKAGILTKGGPWSNHIHACAWACRQLGLPLQVWIKGNERLQTAMLTDVKSWGTKVQFVNRTAFYDKRIAADFAAENNLLYLPMGGADAMGIAESSRFLQELNLPEYNCAICAVGTATTLGGLAFVPGNFENVTGIEVGTNDVKVAAMVTGWQQQLPHKKLLLNGDYPFGGFARQTPELIDFANRLFMETGIPTDIIYTARLFFAMQHLAENHFFPMHSSIMILHSGGLQGNRSLPAGTLQF